MPKPPPRGTGAAWSDRGEGALIGVGRTPRNIRKPIVDVTSAARTISAPDSARRSENSMQFQLFMSHTRDACDLREHTQSALPLLQFDNMRALLRFAVIRSP